jgi:hypothetical protein
VGIGLHVNTGRLGIQYRHADTYVSGLRARGWGYGLAREVWSVPPGGLTLSEDGRVVTRVLPGFGGFWYPTAYFPGGVYDHPAFPLVGVERKIDPNLEIYPPGADPEEGGDASDDGRGGEDEGRREDEEAAGEVTAAAVDPLVEAIRSERYAAAAALLEGLEAAEDALERRERTRLRILLAALRGEWGRSESLARELFLEGAAVGSADPGWREVVGGESLRDLLEEAVRAAHARDRASSWLVVSMLMRSEGRDGVADRMIERAKRRVLEASGDEADGAEAGGAGDGSI